MGDGVWPSAGNPDQAPGGEPGMEDTFPAIAFARIAFANMPAKAQIGCDAATQQNQQRP
ncbi:hypothetical protein [Sphingobium limneticum]|uniref:hypothetical protein n=1 Tax=Sphingobium limneticum TaxID=1007511 RepID=UPI001B869A8E|nr:hypothetical protein [Sphingobium limneticum]